MNGACGVSVWRLFLRLLRCIYNVDAEHRRFKPSNSRRTTGEQSEGVRTGMGEGRATTQPRYREAVVVFALGLRVLTRLAAALRLAFALGLVVFFLAVIGFWGVGLLFIDKVEVYLFL